MKYGINTITALLVTPYIQLHSVIPCIKCPRRSKYKTTTTCMFAWSCKCELHVESLHLNNRSFVLRTFRQREIKQGYCTAKIRKRLGLHKFIWSFAGNVAPCIFHLCNHIINKPHISHLCNHIINKPHINLILLVINGKISNLGLLCSGRAPSMNDRTLG